MSEWMNEYLHEVRTQIRWKRAHSVVLRELECHLQDQYEAYRADGMTRSEAEQETLRQMGDPVSVGKALNLVHRPKIAWEVLASMAVLLIGSLCLWTFVFYKVSDWSLNHWLWTPLWATLLGGGLCVLISRVDMNALSKRAWLIYGACLLIMGGAVLYSVVFLIGGVVGGVNYLGYYAGTLLPVAYGCAVYALRNRGGKGLVFCIAALLPLIVLTWLTHSLWVLVCLSVSALAMLLTANRMGCFGESKRKNVGIIIGASLSSVLVYLFAASDKLLRAFFPLGDSMESNFMGQYVQGLLRHSRPFGPGEAFSVAAVPFPVSPDKSRFLLDDVLSTEYLLAGVAYLCGWVTALVLLLAMIVFLVLLLRQIMKQKTFWGRLIALAVVIPLLVHTTGYILMNLGLPMSSFRLPLLSYGGKFRVMDLMLLGLLFAAIRSKTIMRDDWEIDIDNKILTSAK